MSNTPTTNTAVMPAEAGTPHGGRMVKAADQVRPLQLNTFEDMWKFAGALARSNMLPKSYCSDKEKEKLDADGVIDLLRSKALVALQLGAEVGLQPMQSIQSIYVVNGLPTLWGDGQLAVVRQSGLLESIREWNEGKDASLVCYCEVKRKGDPTPVQRSFSWSDAIRAKLTNKDTYQAYPARMCGHRARALAIRDTFPDVLKGLTHTYEEMIDVTPQKEESRAVATTKVDDMTEVLEAEAAAAEASSETTSAEESAGADPAPEEAAAAEAEQDKKES